jgi:nicotinic acid phosphoribosyltransferase
LRDLLDALERTTEKSRKFLRENPLPRRDETDALNQLKKSLELETIPTGNRMF